MLSVQLDTRLCVSRVSKILLNTVEEEAEEQEQTTSTTLRRTTRKRRSSVSIQIGNPTTGTTPQRLHSTSVVPSEVKRRKENCKGHASYRLPHGFLEDRKTNLHNSAGARGYCRICETKTHNYCLGCHTWYCAEATRSTAQNDDALIQVEGLFEKGKPVIVFNSCFMKGHPTDQELSELAARMFP
jgi:hypothetical protein